MKNLNSRNFLKPFSSCFNYPTSGKITDKFLYFSITRSARGKGYFKQPRVYLLIMSLAFLSSTVVGQSDGPSQDILYPALKITRTGGWPIPPAQLSPAAKRRVFEAEGVQLEGIPLLPDSGVLLFENQYVVSPTEVRVVQKTARAWRMAAYEAFGRRFAYMVIYQSVDVSPSGNVTPMAALNLPIYFIDRDGNGTFEERIQSREFPDLPLWVKGLAKSK